MKVKLEFNSTTDNRHITLLAVRAEDVYYLFDDLLDQLAHWIDENPGDQQGKAFETTRQWLFQQIDNRGLNVPSANHAVAVDRAGNPRPRPNQPGSFDSDSKHE